MILIILGAAIIIVWAYILFIRPRLIVKHPEFGKFAKAEEALFAKSRTILAARLYWVGGLLVGLQQLAAQAGVDTTPVTNELAKMIPEGYRSLAVGVAMLVTGVGFEWLRRVTTSPIPDKE
jgi:hypothetical protein